ncbi:hypothetical protein KC359_g98 [Hortaea werneckii]|nr:hypothetical protein KC359_g98 [Hortaea werneckii]
MCSPPPSLQTSPSTGIVGLHSAVQVSRKHPRWQWNALQRSYTVSNLRMAENSSVTADLRGRNIGEDRCSPFALLIWRLANNVVGAIRRHYG